MLEQRLQQLAIDEQRAMPVSIAGTAKHVKAAFGGALSPSLQGHGRRMPSSDCGDNNFSPMHCQTCS